MEKEIDIIQMIRQRRFVMEALRSLLAPETVYQLQQKTKRITVNNVSADIE